MIDLAKHQSEGFQIVAADACALPFKENVFDIIVSNLAYQWVADLSKAFDLCYKSLSPQGLLCFTMFGRNTLDELFLSLENCMDKKDQSQLSGIRRLPSRAEILKAMQRSGFSNVNVDYERIKVRFPDMMALIQWVKEIGANTLGQDVYIGKDLLTKANDYYNKSFKDRLGIYATFEVVWVEARK